MDPLSNGNQGGSPNGGQGGGAQPAASAGGAQPLETRGGTPTQPAQPATQVVPTTQPLETRAFDREAAMREGAAVEGRRQTDIRSLAQRLNIEEAVVTPLLADSTRSLEHARSVFLEHVAVRDQALGTRGAGVPFQVGQDERTKVRAACELALLHRSMPSRYSLDEEQKDTPALRETKLSARSFAGMSLSRLGEELTRRADSSYRWNGQEDLLKRMFQSTSDFPNIAEGVLRRTLRDSYAEAEASWRPWVRQTTMKDFRTTNRLQLSAAADLAEVPQSGELQRTTLGESAEGYALTQYGSIIGINSRTIINDDLDALGKVPTLMAQSARRKESDLVYAVLTANAAMSDAVALFHATHANLITPALSDTGLSKAIESMRKQTGQKGELLNLRPQFLIVPAALERTGWQLINGDIVATSFGNANPHKGRWTLVIEPRLDASSATVWYFSCQNSDCDGVEIAFLEGTSGPQVMQEESFNFIGRSYRVVHSVGTKAIDFRGVGKSSATT